MTMPHAGRTGEWEHEEEIPIPAEWEAPEREPEQEPAEPIHVPEKEPVPV
jgi:hypothetical protein